MAKPALEMTQKHWHWTMDINAAALLPLVQRTAVRGLEDDTLLLSLARGEILDGGGQLPAHYTTPVAIWQFGQDLTLVINGRCDLQE